MKAMGDGTEAKRSSVLVVDDDPGMRLTLEGVLADEYDVHCVSSAPAALTSLATTQYDVVVTDFDGMGSGGDVATRRVGESVTRRSARAFSR